jgi:hypothetical protein
VELRLRLRLLELRPSLVDLLLQPLVAQQL